MVLGSFTQLMPRRSVDSASQRSSETDLEEVPLVRTRQVEASASTETMEGKCRICLETAPLDELEEPCGCKGSLQRVHKDCLQRWIDERDPRGNDPLVCEICLQKYHPEHYRPPPPRPPPQRPNRVERVMVGQELYVIVVDPQTGMATARHVGGVEDLVEDENAAYQDRLNPVSACVISFFLFIICSLLLSHLFAALPGPGPSIDPSGAPARVDDETADAEFQDVSATLLLLWLMMRLLVLIAPVYTISRMFGRARAARERYLAGNAASEEGLELNNINIVVESGVPPAASQPR